MPANPNPFSGKVLGGMKLTPCGGYMVYPLGSILVVRSMTGKNKQAFLEGHTSEISCVAMSSDGTRIVSGQVRVLLLLLFGVFSFGWFCHGGCGGGCMFNY